MKHVKNLDGLRAWMAWWVVCQHVLQLSGVDKLYDNPLVRLLTMGGLAVMVFATVSGYVIANLVLVRQEAFATYLKRRFFRIYPLYAIAIAAAFILRDTYRDTVAAAPWAAATALQRFAETQQELPAHVILHALLAHGLVPNWLLPHASVAILAPAWSLSLEWQFYLVAPVIMYAFQSRSFLTRVGTVLLIVALMSAAFIGKPLERFEYPAFLPLVVGFFALGMLTRISLDGEKPRLSRFPWIIVALNVILYCQAYTGGHLIVAIIPIGIWCAAIFASAYTGKSRILNPLSKIFNFALGNKAVVALGLWSYSTYLLHIPLFVASLGISRELGVQITPLNYLLVLLLSCLLLVPFSWASYRFVEQVGIRWGGAIFLGRSKRGEIA